LYVDGKLLFGNLLTSIPAMPNHRQNRISAAWFLIPAVALTTSIAPGLSAQTAPVDPQKKLQQLEKQRAEFHQRAQQVRKQEQLALLEVSHIKTKLKATTGVLHEHEHKLQKTESNIKQTEIRLDKTQSAEEILTDGAAKRLREIYEGNRISLVEMMFQVDSLQALLDRFYFQERIAELDRDLLHDLRAKASALAQKKDQLGEQRNKLGDLVSEFAKKAIAIAKEKFQTEQVADRLKTQRAFYEQAERQLINESHRLETQIQEMETSNRKANKNMAVGSGTMAMPIHAQVTSPFGWRRHPIFGVRKFHTGVDLAGPNHSAIRAADSGNVLYTGWYGGYGRVVILSHGKGMATLYAHMSKTAVEVGQNVSKGDVVGYEGTTGFSTGPHLHFEVRVDGKPNNPLNFLH
jgi:murein DD-endopeptidase MepM/ murein hydrolase activator NlpD